MILAHRSENDDAEFMPALLDLGWDAEDRDDTWLISFADLISTTLAMVVLLFGRAALTTPADAKSQFERNSPPSTGRSSV